MKIKWDHKGDVCECLSTTLHGCRLRSPSCIGLAHSFSPRLVPSTSIPQTALPLAVSAFSKALGGKHCGHFGQPSSSAPNLLRQSPYVTVIPSKNHTRFFSWLFPCPPSLVQALHLDYSSKVSFTLVVTRCYCAPIRSQVLAHLPTSSLPSIPSHHCQIH